MKMISTYAFRSLCSYGFGYGYGWCPLFLNICSRPSLQLRHFTMDGLGAPF